MESHIYDFISRAFIVLFIYSGLACLIGFIKPYFVLWWLPKEKHTRDRVLITYFTLSIFSLFIIAVFSMPIGEVFLPNRILKKRIIYEKDNAKINKIVKAHIQNVYGSKVAYFLKDNHLTIYYRASEDITMNMIHVLGDIPHKEIIRKAGNLFYGVFNDENLDFIREITIYPRMKVIRIGKDGAREEFWDDIAAIQMPYQLASKINWSSIGKQTIPIEELEEVFKRNGCIRWLF